MSLLEMAQLLLDEKLPTTEGQPVYPCLGSFYFLEWHVVFFLEYEYF